MSRAAVINAATPVRILAMSVLCLTVALAAYTPTKGNTAEICMEAGALEAALIDWYGERPSLRISPNTVRWESETTDTWTIVRYTTNGNACTLDQSGT